jgi:hypothetical protein
VSLVNFLPEESTQTYCAEVKILKQRGFQSLGTSLGIFYITCNYLPDSNTLAFCTKAKVMKQESF